MPRLPGKPVRARSLNGHAPTALRAHSRTAEPELDWNENMPVIRIAVDEDDPDAGRYAAAVMAAMLAMAAEPFPELPAQGKWSKPEKRCRTDAMFALWVMRTRFRGLAAQELQLVGVPGYDITKAREEHLESADRVFVRKGGKVPTRQINGAQLRMRMSGYTRDLAAALSGWGIVHAQAGEFIVPDVPTLKMATFIPLSPTLALVGAVPDGDVVEETVAEE
jgi:hypothetical protein